MPLKRDICRCRDAGCPERDDCARFLERETGTEQSASLFPYDIPLGDPCPHRIPPEEEAKP